MADNTDFPEDPRDLTEEQRKQIKIEFAPGCFDDFSGTQEELDELLADLHRMIETGEIFEQSKPMDMDELMEEDPEFAQAILERLGGSTLEEIDVQRKRTLN